jgi:uncharacterized Zn finger protein (UPF0148 family)
MKSCDLCGTPIADWDETLCPSCSYACDPEQDEEEEEDAL